VEPERFRCRGCAPMHGAKKLRAAPLSMAKVDFSFAVPLFSCRLKILPFLSL
jgi:hypothetical protein